jgi:antitoxin HigA-1
MMRNFRHKGLKRLFEDDDRSKVSAQDADRLRRILARLNRSRMPNDMAAPGFRLHPMKGDRKDFWAVTVRANWRVIFRFEGEDAADVDLIDYHEEDDTMRMKNPPHPGEHVLEDCLKPSGLSITKGADVLGVTRLTLSNLVNGKNGVSPEMAIRLSKAFGGSPEVWLGMQMEYDLAQAAKNEAKIKVKRVRAEPLPA